MRLKNYILFSLVVSKITCTFATHIIVELKNNIMNDIESITGEIVMYQPDETIRLEVRVENETVWLTQQQMADLFLTTRNNVTLHIGNIFKEGELVETSVRKDSLLTASDGKKYRTKIYNLDVIISVGYRVKSKRGTQFRQWANKVLYLFGASLKDAGKKLFAYIKMQETPATELLNNIR